MQHLQLHFCSIHSCILTFFKHRFFYKTTRTQLKYMPSHRAFEVHLLWFSFKENNNKILVFSKSTHSTKRHLFLERLRHTLADQSTHKKTEKVTNPLFGQHTTLQQGPQTGHCRGSDRPGCATCPPHTVRQDDVSHEALSELPKAILGVDGGGRAEDEAGEESEEFESHLWVFVRIQAALEDGRNLFQQVTHHRSWRQIF